MADGAADRVPFRRLIGLALTRLGWSPAVFWSSTPSELYAALEITNGEARRRDFAAFKSSVEVGVDPEIERREGDPQ